jgi:hypothetical protein
MTISSTNRIAGPYAGDGSTATFPFTFKAFATSDITVVTRNVTTGALAVLTLNSDFSATLDADQDSNPGGSITLLAGNLATGMTLSITTGMPLLQTLNLVNGGGFFPDVINDHLDTITILIQQLQLQLARAIQIAFGDGGGASMLLPVAALRAGKLLGFDSVGNLQLVSIVGGGGGGILASPQTANPSPDGVTTIFTFIAPAGATPGILVFVGGVLQDPATDYATPTFVSGTTWQVAFTSAPVNGPIKILLLG